MDTHQSPDLPPTGSSRSPSLTDLKTIPLRAWPVGFKHFQLSFPQSQVVQVTLNRPDKLNCVDKATSQEIAEVWEAFDRDESLLVGLITGAGRAFCTGADLHEWNEMNKSGVVNDMRAPGLAGLPRRGGKKPIIAAVNGLCMGGGFEMVANCDLVVAARSAVFALSEVRRGIVPVAGSLPRLASTLGLQRTMELALTGRGVSATTLHGWGLVARVVDDGHVTGAALALAAEICSNSPDAVIVGRVGVRLGWETGNVEEAVTALAEHWYPHLVRGPNFAEGIRAFAEKRGPKWVGSKL